MKFLTFSIAIVLMSYMTSCNQNQSEKELTDVILEFGKLNDSGKLESSAKKEIQFNFKDPSKSKSKTLQVREVEHSITKKNVISITLTGGSGSGTPPVQGKIITERGYVFEHNSSCFIYGTISTDTETGAQWFTPADPATQSTMNNCNYGDVA